VIPNIWAIGQKNSLRLAIIGYLCLLIIAFVPAISTALPHALGY
jgi:hypothetical protein